MRLASHAYYALLIAAPKRRVRCTEILFSTGIVACALYVDVPQIYAIIVLFLLRLSWQHLAAGTSWLPQYRE